MVSVRVYRPEIVTLGALKVRVPVAPGSFNVTLHDDRDQQVQSYDGNVPTWMPGDHGGDEIILDIDVATGRILNWRTADLADLLATWVNGLR